MKFSLKHRTKEELLEQEFSDLMRKSYKKALKNKSQSDLLKERAEMIYQKLACLQQS